MSYLNRQHGQISDLGGMQTHDHSVHIVTNLSTELFVQKWCCHVVSAAGETGSCSYVL